MSKSLDMLLFPCVQNPFYWNFHGDPIVTGDSIACARGIDCALNARVAPRGR